MKRTARWVALAVLLLALAFPVINLVAGPDTSAALPDRTGEAVPHWREAAAIFKRKCVHCHAPATPKPFYASFPIAKGLVERDVKRGLEWLDLRAELFRDERPPLSEAAVAKVERALAEGSMPPGKYLLLHWNHALSGDDKQTLDTWIKQTRAKYFATAGVADDHAGGPLQPLPEVASLKLNPKKVSLGNKLFHDKRLSKDSSISCASCHGMHQGGTDQVKVSTGVGGKQGPINSPTVFNAGLQYRQFWDGRARDLFEQADGPVNNPIEMAANWKMVTERLKQDEALVAEISASYADGVTGRNIRDAIATFEESLLTPSRFDDFLRGKKSALTPAEKKGLAAFTGAGCVTCHVGKVLGGQSFEKMGRFKSYPTGRQPGDVDRGRYNVTRKARDRGRFKVPMLRNIALTHPYFHDGSASSLEAAVSVMARHQLEHGLHIDRIKDIVAFLEALTGSYDGKPLASK